ncbi:MAG: flavodoxin family protein [Dysosmobacter sp.]
MWSGAVCEVGSAAAWTPCGRTALTFCRLETERKLENYRLVIVGTPVWAGRCSSVIRSFLKNHGGEMKRVAYVLTRGSEHKSEDIYRQMDQYTGKPHQAATSLRVGHVGHTFWQEEFLRQIRELLAEEE